ncbi:putative ATP-binding cassette transporter [Pantoea sp. PA1]|uniref:cyclic peptide export ABC transporter n=1 Tax=Pantoea ananas TaxID=553 RepID=UPI001B30DA75|nr:cyclic peptide export ABC transporter [Pantoea ananatis]
MKLITYLYKNGPLRFLSSIFFGVLSGLAGSGVVNIISYSVTHLKNSTLAISVEFFGLCFLYFISKSISEVFIMRLTQDAVFKMRVELSKKLLATPYKQIQSIGSAKLLVVMTKDIETFLQATKWVPIVFGNIMVILGCLFYIASFSLDYFYFILVTLTVSGVTFNLSQRRPLNKLKKVRAQLDVLYDIFQNLIEGSKELIINNKRAKLFIKEILTPSSIYFRDLYVSSRKSYILLLNSSSIIFYITIGLVLFVSPIFFPQNEGVVATVTLVLLYLVRPITETISALPFLQDAGISLNKILALEKEFPKDEIKEIAKKEPFSFGEFTGISLCNICHAFPSATDDSQFLLGPLNLDIKPGELMFVIGGNGSGKTTLAMLLLGLYSPDEGILKLNDIEVTDLNRFYYRQNFSAIFSDYHLFEKLLYAHDNDLRKKANYYISALQIQHKVKIVDGNFSTVKLSTGQRKRLALVSSILEDRPIYLFDEWAADQDPIFKKVFYCEILPELKSKGKTVIVISHDDSYFEVADRVIKIENGAIVDLRINT